MLQSILCDYSDAYKLVKGIIIVPNTPVTGQPVNNNGVEVMFKNYAPFTNFISEINNT